MIAENRDDPRTWTHECPVCGETVPWHWTANVTAMGPDGYTTIRVCNNCTSKAVIPTCTFFSGV